MRILKFVGFMLLFVSVILNVIAGAIIYTENSMNKQGIAYTLLFVAIVMFGHLLNYGLTYTKEIK